MASGQPESTQLTPPPFPTSEVDQQALNSNPSTKEEKAESSALPPVVVTGTSPSSSLSNAPDPVTASQHAGLQMSQSSTERESSEPSTQPQQLMLSNVPLAEDSGTQNPQHDCSLASPSTPPQKFLAESSHFCDRVVGDAEQKDPARSPAPVGEAVDVFLGVSFERKPRKGFFAAVGIHASCPDRQQTASFVLTQESASLIKTDIDEDHMVGADQSSAEDESEEVAKEKVPETTKKKKKAKKKPLHGSSGWKTLPSVAPGCDQPIAWAIEAVSVVTERIVQAVFAVLQQQEQPLPPTASESSQEQAPDLEKKDSSAPTCFRLNMAADSARVLRQVLRIEDHPDAVADWLKELGQRVERGVLPAKPKAAPQQPSFWFTAAQFVDMETQIQMQDERRQQLECHLLARLDDLCQFLGIPLPGDSVSDEDRDSESMFNRQSHLDVPTLVHGSILSAPEHAAEARHAFRVAVAAVELLQRGDLEVLRRTNQLLVRCPTP